jgi:hypothetical protein
VALALAQWRSGAGAGAGGTDPEFQIFVRSSKSLSNMLSCFDYTCYSTHPFFILIFFLSKDSDMK